VKNILRGHTDGKVAGIVDFQTIGVKIYENVPSCCIGLVDNGIGDELSYNLFTVIRNEIPK
jgi:hypothetical protein